MYLDTVSMCRHKNGLICVYALICSHNCVSSKIKPTTLHIIIQIWLAHVMLAGVGILKTGCIRTWLRECVRSYSESASCLFMARLCKPTGMLLIPSESVIVWSLAPARPKTDTTSDSADNDVEAHIIVANSSTHFQYRYAPIEDAGQPWGRACSMSVRRGRRRKQTRKENKAPKSRRENRGV